MSAAAPDVVTTKGLRIGIRQQNGTDEPLGVWMHGTVGDLVSGAEFYEVTAI
jgi:hypothetical protein